MSVIIFLLRWLSNSFLRFAHVVLAWTVAAPALDQTMSTSNLKPLGSPACRCHESPQAVTVLAESGAKVGTATTQLSQGFGRREIRLGPTLGVSDCYELVVLAVIVRLPATAWCPTACCASSTPSMRVRTGRFVLGRHCRCTVEAACVRLCRLLDWMQPVR
jgi:hypothetical protein